MILFCPSTEWSSKSVLHGSLNSSASARSTCACYIDIATLNCWHFIAPGIRGRDNSSLAHAHCHEIFCRSHSLAVSVMVPVPKFFAIARICGSMELRNVCFPRKLARY